MSSEILAWWGGVFVVALVIDVGAIVGLRWWRARAARPQPARLPLRAAPATPQPPLPLRAVPDSPQPAPLPLAAEPASAQPLPRPLAAAPRRLAVSWRAVAGLRAYVVIAALLAPGLVGIALIIRERWLGDQELSFWQPSWWCQVPGLCESLYRPFIFLALAGALLVVGLVAGLRLSELTHFHRPLGPAAENLAAPVAFTRQRRLGFDLAGAATVGCVVDAALALAQARLPGWEYAALLLLYLAGWTLADVPWARWSAALRQHGAWLLPFTLAHLALINFIVRAYGECSYPNWALALLVVAGGWLLLRARRVPPILWIVTLALVVFCLDLNAWWSSSIGDEYAFYFKAIYLVTREGAQVASQALFDVHGVYGTHPIFSSIIQAIPVAIFGPTGAAWRLSSPYLAAWSVALFYSFVRTYASRRFALTAALLLAVSHYLMAFSKIGYNNLQALFALALVLACVGWVIRTRLPLAYVCLGLSFGLCFYVYPAALYALPVGGLLLLAEARPRTAAAYRRWALLAGSLLLVIFPLLLQPDYWLLKLQGTFFNDPSLLHSLQALSVNLGANFVYALGGFLYIAQQSHLVVGGYVDPLTAVLVLLGLGLLLRHWRVRFARLWLLTFLMQLVLVGASHDRSAPPNTRMFLLLPWLALLAAVGLRWLWQSRRALHLDRLPAWPLAAPAVAALLVVNLFQAYALAPAKSLDLQGLEAGVVRLSQLAQRQAPGQPLTFVVMTDPSWGIDGLKLIPAVYPVDAQFSKIVVTSTAALLSVPPDTAAMLLDENAVIIIKPWLEKGWQAALESQIAAFDKTGCAGQVTGGVERFRLWHSPAWERLCAPPAPLSQWWFWSGL